MLALLRRGAPRGARPLAVGAVVGGDLGLGGRAVPVPAPEKLTIEEGAAASATLTAVLIVFGAAVVLVLPSLGLLYTLAQRSMIEEGEKPRGPT